MRSKHKNVSATNKNRGQGLVTTVQVKKLSLSFSCLFTADFLFPKLPLGCRRTGQSWDPVFGGLIQIPQQSLLKNIAAEAV